jgi:hypothetical protein
MKTFSVVLILMMRYDTMVHKVKTTRKRQREKKT